MKRIIAAFLVALLPVAAAAGILGQNRTVGSAAPLPEDLNVMGNGLRVGARVITESTKQPALESVPGDRLRFEAGFLPPGPLPAGTVALDCTVRFLSARRELSDPVKQGTCFDGSRDVAKGEWVTLDVTTVFFPTKDDPSGTSGVVIEITDTIGGSRLKLMPTYGFSGGSE